MPSFDLHWKSSALGDLRVLPREVVVSCLKKIEALKRNPFPPGFKKIQGAERTYRLRVGRYRIIYQVDRSNQVLVIYHIRHRKDAYRTLPSAGRS